MNDEVFKKSIQAPPLNTKMPMSKPGGLKTEAQMIIHTKIAHAIFYGRRADRKSKKPSIIGLALFAKNSKMIWDQAAIDDPYADNKLLEIESALDNAALVIRKCTETVDEIISGMNNISVVSDKSSNPISLPLTFTCPYGYMGARLLADFDSLMIKILTAAHMGLVFGNDKYNLERDAGRAIRHAFRISSGFRSSGASRDDFAANNQRAQDALKKNGSLDEDVLSGKKRAKVSPKIKRVEEVFGYMNNLHAGNLNLHTASSKVKK